MNEIKDNLLIYDSFAKTGNNVIDVVLTQKSLFCASKNIRFTYMVDAEALSIFSNNDLASLFGNIIDNAIEASMKVTDDFRLIKLNVYTNNNILIISQSNYTNVIPEFVLGLPETTKINTLTHGYGLKSIKYICSKYNGQMNIEFEDNKFRIELMFPLEK
jgi:sensor histidine kinase regulating citrate/malate metabolism